MACWLTGRGLLPVRVLVLHFDGWLAGGEISSPVVENTPTTTADAAEKHGGKGKVFPSFRSSRPKAATKKATAKCPEGII